MKGRLPAHRMEIANRFCEVLVVVQPATSDEDGRGHERECSKFNRQASFAEFTNFGAKVKSHSTNSNYPFIRQ